MTERSEESSNDSNGEVRCRKMFRKKRRTARIAFKVTMCICSISTCATILWLALYMRNQIFNFNEISSNQLDHNQAVDEAEFGYFGPQAENLWRAFLISNLGLSFLVSLYIPLGVLFEHYYPVILYGALMFAESILSIGNQYMSVPYYLASAMFFTTGLVAHLFVHFLRVDTVDEVIAWKQYQNEQWLKRTHSF
ncbi:hypothetical protein BLOT_004238 [Blomia tropicalis]|nr:hypothetical protein BLOT_004238 [Blomia tropicalis]